MNIKEKFLSQPLPYQLSISASILSLLGGLMYGWYSPILYALTFLIEVLVASVMWAFIVVSAFLWIYIAVKSIEEYRETKIHEGGDT